MTRIFHRNIFAIGAITAKREYKNHPHGHGIEVLNCKYCKQEFTNIGCRGKNPTCCDRCRYK